MRVHVRGPRRQTLEVDGRRTVAQLLAELGLDPGTVLVIRGDELLTPDVLLGPEDEIEVRPVVSGG
ncbi:MAG TPA: MoaD/ThiS family protein [Dehalococcoidia bacterium]|nr:MoaD/ThiS family protein [Dehalococcoidia bacterium]